MLTIYVNTTTRECYDADGNQFRDGMPRLSYMSRDTVAITLCTETPEGDGAGVSPSTWPRDTSYNVSGIGAMLTVDSDYIHKLKGALAAEVPSGSVSSVTATIEGASYAKIPSSGVLRLFDAYGNYEALAYTARSIDGTSVTFTTSGTITGAYTTGATMDCDQSPYCSALMDTAASNVEQGEFVFQLVVNSDRLREEMDYTDTEKLSVKGIEILLYKTTGGADEPLNAFVCDTFSIVGTIGAVGFEAEPPDAMENRLAGLVDQLLAAGFEVEHQYDSEGNTQFRFRSVDAGGTWSNWVTVQKGDRGEKGETGAIGPQGEVGPQGNPGPANVLTIGTVTTGEPGTQAAATITGESPNQVLNLTIPRGDKGEAGTGGGSGDMLESVYDTNGDGKVNAADEADAALNVGGKTAAQVADAVNNSHSHSNKTTLDKLGESGGKLTFDGAEIGGGGTADSVAWENVTGKPSTFPPESHTHEIANVNGLQAALDAKGTVKSVNGVEPDSSGNVTIETGGGGGGSADESRLLPAAANDGDTVVYQEPTQLNDANTVLYIHPPESNGEIRNIAVAGADNLIDTYSNIEVDEDGNMIFNGSAELQIPAGSLPVGVCDNTGDWELDVKFYISDTSRATQYIWGNGSQQRWDCTWGKDETIVFNGGTGWAGLQWHTLTYSQWREGDSSKYVFYRDGMVVTSGTVNFPNLRTVTIYIGSGDASEPGRRLIGKIAGFRIRKICEHRGENFTPPDFSTAGSGSWVATPLPSSAETVICCPPASVTESDGTERYCRLDATTPTIELFDRVRNISKVRMVLKSANPEITGNIVLVPAVDGTEKTAVTLAVGATEQEAEISFSEPVSGLLSFRRDYVDNADTLQDTEPVTAKVLYWELVR